MLVLRVFSRTENITSTELRLEYALEGTTNFVAWKIHMEAVLDDNRLLDYIKTNLVKPPVVDAQDLSQWKNNVAKVRRIVWEGVRDTIVSNLHGKETPFAMWKTLTDLFENKNEHRNLALKYKLHIIKMQKNDTILQYLRTFTQFSDELGRVGIIVPE